MFEQTNGKKIMIKTEQVLSIEEYGSKPSGENPAREVCLIRSYSDNNRYEYLTYVSFNDLWEMFKIKEHVETGNYKEEK